jgi:hypothetical protein
MNRPADISMALLSEAVAAVIALSSPAVAGGGTGLPCGRPVGRRAVIQDSDESPRSQNSERS